MTRITTNGPSQDDLRPMSDWQRDRMSPAFDTPRSALSRVTIGDIAVLAVFTALVLFLVML